MHNDWDREDINGNALIVSSVFWEPPKMGKLVTFALVDDDDESYVSCDEDEIMALGRTSAIDDEMTVNNVDEMEQNDFDDDEEKEERILLKLELKTFS